MKTGKVEGSRVHVLRQIGKYPSGNKKYVAECGAGRNFYGHETGEPVTCMRCQAIIYKIADKMIDAPEMLICP